MVSVLLVCTGLLTASPPEEPVAALRETYEAARARVGHDPDAQVRLALWGVRHTVCRPSGSSTWPWRCWSTRSTPWRVA
ncbi:MAG: hypothetical protein IRY99_06580 [Isosphaeraceae bacterium]|nr:hypothetical protein [Isosphaeraceae bacterium]